jgi:hypothetical protein
MRNALVLTTMFWLLRHSAPPAADWRKDIESLALLDFRIEALQKTYIAAVQENLDVIRQFAIVGKHIWHKDRVELQHLAYRVPHCIAGTGRNVNTGLSRFQT